MGYNEFVLTSKNYIRMCSDIKGDCRARAALLRPEELPAVRGEAHLGADIPQKGQELMMPDACARCTARVRMMRLGVWTGKSPLTSEPAVAVAKGRSVHGVEGRCVCAFTVG